MVVVSNYIIHNIMWGVSSSTEPTISSKHITEPEETCHHELLSTLTFVALPFFCLLYKNE